MSEPSGAAASAAWGPIADFRGRVEFDRFTAWLEEQVAVGRAAERPVATRYVGTALHERWFEQRATGAIWRLVWPDPPFGGIFEQVSAGTSGIVFADYGLRIVRTDAGLVAEYDSGQSAGSRLIRRRLTPAQAQRAMRDEAAAHAVLVEIEHEPEIAPSEAPPAT